MNETTILDPNQQAKTEKESHLSALKQVFQTLELSGLSVTDDVQALLQTRIDGGDTVDIFANPGKDESQQQARKLIYTNPADAAHVVNSMLMRAEQSQPIPKERMITQSLEDWQEIVQNLATHGFTVSPQNLSAITTKIEQGQLVAPRYDDHTAERINYSDPEQCIAAYLDILDSL